eukprot:scaffold12417_cov131-Isochrysis_galbana.AAC.16
MARTMFWILKSVKRAGKSSFWIIRAYLRAACRACKVKRAARLSRMSMPRRAVGAAHLLLRLGARHHHLARFEDERRPANATGRSQPSAHTKNHATRAWQRGIWPRWANECAGTCALSCQPRHPCHAAAHVFGSRMRMMTAEKRCRQEARIGQSWENPRPGRRDRTFGLYSALRACMAIVLRSSVMPRLHVATIFLPRRARMSPIGNLNGLRGMWGEAAVLENGADVRASMSLWRLDERRRHPARSGFVCHSRGRDVGSGTLCYGCSASGSLADGVSSDTLS